MNGNSDKHKPLSPEELFRLLETKNEGALSGEGLDDFEKEALEGFSAHTSAGKARQLTEEVHQRIHEKLNEPEKKRPAGRIVWFGAAASVMLILIVSVYFLTREAKSSPELAMNKEVVDELKPLPAPPAVAEASPAIADKQAEEENKPQAQLQPAARKITASRAQSPLEEISAISQAGTGNGDGDFKRSKNDVSAADLSLEKSKDQFKKAEGKAISSYDTNDDTQVTKTQEQDHKFAYAINGTVAANKSAPPKGDLANTIPAAEKVQKESPVTTYEGVSAVSKTNGDQLLKNKKSKETDAETYPLTTVNAAIKTEETKGSTETMNTAYDEGYIGGDQGIKTHVITWFKEHHYEAPKGNYHIRLRVKADGKTEVLEVKGGKDADERVVKPLEESLKAMKGWKPAITGQKAVDSERAFTLSF